jgi:hypothetical protein
MAEDFGMPTTLDWLHGYAYALDQVNKMKCEDPQIIKQLCDSTVKVTGKPMGGGTCIKWEQDISERSYPVPDHLYIKECTKDSDCEMGVCGQGGQCTCTTDRQCVRGLDCIENPNDPSNNICGFAPQNVASGHCLFANETACVAQGRLPYTCTAKTCTNRPKKENTVPYTEWRKNKTTGESQCVLGNFVLRQWCEEPQSRCTVNKKTGDYPTGCTKGADSPGVTDVPAFLYDSNQGACYMTHDYCKWFGKDYNMESNTCSTDADCQKDNVDWYCQKTEQGGYCSGPGSQCYIPTGEKVGEFILGKTLFYMFKKGGCKHEAYQGPDEKDEKNNGIYDMRKAPEGSDPDPEFVKSMTENIVQGFSKIDDMVCSLADPGRMTRKKLIAPNFAGPGINLYLIQFDNANKASVGFDATEVEKKYPHLVEDHYCGKFICVNRDEIKGDKNIQRIYLSIGSKSWITNILTNKIMSLAQKKQ